MQIDTAYLIYGAIVLSVLLLVEGVVSVVRDSRRGKINRRLRMLGDGGDGGQVLERLRRNARIAEDGIGGRALGALAARLTAAGMVVPVQRFALTMAALGALGALIPLAVAPHVVGLGVPLPLAATAGAVLLGLLGPLVYLSTVTRRRIDAFNRQLPDALEAMVRSLEAGHPVPAAMQLVASEMPDPIGTEFGIAVDEMTYGKDLQEALRSLGQRVPTPEFQYVVVSIGIQSESGGNLSEVLRSLASVIRDRQRMFLKVKALSGEGRTSAKILTALPVFTLLTVFGTSPNFYLDVMDDPIFWPAATVFLVLMALGLLVINRMVNFKV